MMSTSPRVRSEIGQRGRFHVYGALGKDLRSESDRSRAQLAGGRREPGRAAEPATFGVPVGPRQVVGLGGGSRRPGGGNQRMADEEPPETPPESEQARGEGREPTAETAGHAVPSEEAAEIAGSAE